MTSKNRRQLKLIRKLIKKDKKLPKRFRQKCKTIDGIVEIMLKEAIGKWLWMYEASDKKYKRFKKNKKLKKKRRKKRDS